MVNHAEPVLVRPDVDIVEDLNHVFHTYPPLSHDRSRMIVAVENGVVTVSGHVRTDQSRDIFVREVMALDGVTAVNADELYDDESLRRQAGNATPFGVFASVSYGAVVLAGKVPEGVTIESIVAQVEQIPGVRKVIPSF